MSPEVTRYINAICLQGKRKGVTRSHLIGDNPSVCLMADTVSLRLGHAAGLTAHRAVIQHRGRRFTTLHRGGIGLCVGDGIGWKSIHL